MLVVHIQGMKVGVMRQMITPSSADAQFSALFSQALADLKAAGAPSLLLLLSPGCYETWQPQKSEAERCTEYTFTAAEKRGGSPNCQPSCICSAAALNASEPAQTS